MARSEALGLLRDKVREQRDIEARAQREWARQREVTLAVLPLAVAVPLAMIYMGMAFHAIGLAVGLGVLVGLLLALALWLTTLLAALITAATVPGRAHADASVGRSLQRGLPIGWTVNMIGLTLLWVTFFQPLWVGPLISGVAAMIVVLVTTALSRSTPRAPLFPTFARALPVWLEAAVVALPVELPAQAQTLVEQALEDHDALATLVKPHTRDEALVAMREAADEMLALLLGRMPAFCEIIRLAAERPDDAMAATRMAAAQSDLRKLGTTLHQAVTATTRYLSTQNEEGTRTLCFQLDDLRLTTQAHRVFAEAHPMFARRAGV